MTHMARAFWIIALGLLVALLAPFARYLARPGILGTDLHRVISPLTTGLLLLAAAVVAVGTAKVVLAVVHVPRKGKD